jgi:hypothetical protein
MRNFRWTLNGEVVATGYVDFDGSAQVAVVGMAPIGFVSVEAAQERVQALPIGSQVVFEWTT